jgi:hypothetical protein
VRVWFKALVAAAPLVAVLGAGGPVHAGSAAAPKITPANGSVVTSSTVTIRVKTALGGGTLYVDGRPVKTGKNTWLTYTINGKTRPNGPVRVELKSPTLLPWDEDRSTFRMAVPASAPSGVTAAVKGNKVTVRWQKGSEPDLTGYTLSGDLGTRNISASSCGAQCSVTLTAPATASGQATIQLVAKRAGAAPSGATTRTVKVQGTGPAAPPNSGNNGNGNGAPAPAPGGNYTVPNPAQSPIFPTVAPNPDGFSTDNPEVSIVYPTPTDPVGADPSLVSMDNTGLTGTLADESLQWGKSVAIALVLLLCAAHLGTWTRRLRAARADVPGGLRVVPGSAHARVEANRMHIEAALAAAREAEAGKSGARDEIETGGKKRRRFKKPKRKNAEPAPEDLGSTVLLDTAEPEPDFPDELNLEYTPKRPDTAADTPELTASDETSLDLGRPDPDTPEGDEPSADTKILDTAEEDPDAARRSETDKALAALIELARSGDPSDAAPPAEEAAGDRTEVLEHPRRKGFFRR